MVLIEQIETVKLIIMLKLSSVEMYLYDVEIFTTQLYKKIYFYHYKKRNITQLLINIILL
tara:strand:- start:30614 stop:30793 length:180 start_codon:yes stop_codon:yes gene_type:complete